MDGWNTFSFPFGMAYFQGRTVSFRECHKDKFETQQKNKQEQTNNSINIFTWNPNGAPCFEWKGPSFRGLKPQNRGQTGSRYIIDVVVFLGMFWGSPSMTPNLTKSVFFGMSFGKKKHNTVETHARHLPARWFKVPLFGGYLAIERVTFSPSQKGHKEVPGIFPYIKPLILTCLVSIHSKKCPVSWKI